MGFQVESDDTATGVGWYESGVWNARELLQLIGDGDLVIAEDKPYHERFSGRSLYKITVTVERQ